MVTLVAVLALTLASTIGEDFAFSFARPTIANAASAQTFVVLYGQQAVSASSRAAIRQAGGTVVYAYDQIGVAIASSASATFRDDLMRLDKSVENAAGTAPFATQLRDVTDADGPTPGDLPNSTATDADTFSAFQWDMQQIKAPQAHAITGGSRAVLVGDIDTGLDYLHPDLRANVDDANSVNCVSGVPVPGMVAANDDAGHGTHTAGTIAAAANGIGIVGVAPNVRIAGIKAGNSDGFFFPEAVICAFMWAGNHHFDVTNNSYFADPWYFNCKNDPVQRAIWKAEQRAMRFAQQQGVTIVAAEGNFSDDLAHPTQDIISPDTGPGEVRAVHNDCVVIPVEIPGVIGVTATGSLRLKSFYSSYGIGVTQVAAPGGDSLLQSTVATDQIGRGRVLSTYPASLPCGRHRDEPTGDPTYPTAVYCYLQGTSMASPHVAGLAALVISRFGDSKTPQNGKLAPERVKTIIQQTADPTPCPTAAQLALYAPFPSFSNGAPQTCSGGAGYNSWYGNGIVNALRAVTP
jgi:subtilisin family serine protease